jgi:hypothetical protein
MAVLYGGILLTVVAVVGWMFTAKDQSEDTAA